MGHVFKPDYHFDEGAIPVLSVKELNKKFKCVELVPIYKLLEEHLQYAKDNNLMRTVDDNGSVSQNVGE